MSPSAVRAHALRLPPGADLRGELERLGFRAAAILTCVGSLARANLRMPGATRSPGAPPFPSLDENATPCRP